MQQDEVMHVLNDPLAWELLGSNIPARLAYTGYDGARAIPIAFHWTGTEFVDCTPPHAAKVSALQANPTVALTIGTNNFPSHDLLVGGTARIEVTDRVPDEYLVWQTQFSPHLVNPNEVGFGPPQAKERRGTPEPARGLGIGSDGSGVRGGGGR